MGMPTASTARADLDNCARANACANGLGWAPHDHLGWYGTRTQCCRACPAAAVCRGGVTAGALDVPGWLGAVSPDRTPPRAPEMGREVVVRRSSDSEPYFARARCFVAYLFFPVPRGHALGEQLRDTYADATGQGPRHRFEDGSVGIGRGRWFVTRHELPARLQQPLCGDSGNRSDRSNVELPEQFLRRSHRVNPSISGGLRC
jgi:hypothetical protein